MADHFRLSVGMVTLRVDCWKFVWQTRDRLRGHGIAFAAAEDGADSSPAVRREATAWNRVAQCQCAKDGTDCAFLVDVVADEDSIEGPKIDIVSTLVRVEGETFNADADVAAEKSI